MPNGKVDRSLLPRWRHPKRTSRRLFGGRYCEGRFLRRGPRRGTRRVLGETEDRWCHGIADTDCLLSVLITAAPREEATTKPAPSTLKASQPSAPRRRAVTNPPGERPRPGHVTLVAPGALAVGTVRWLPRRTVGFTDNYGQFRWTRIRSLTWGYALFRRWALQESNL